ncbi:MAG: DUF192 domain-containing protein [Phycisphaerae bacterium]
MDKLGVVTVNIKDLSVRAWVADERDEQAKGLMFVTAEELAPLGDGTERGMLFAYRRDQSLGFWMKNTVIDLDIAYIRQDGSIIQTFTMTALRTTPYVPRSAYRYALEVNAGVFEREGVGEGDHVEIPESVLKQPR